MIKQVPIRSIITTCGTPICRLAKLLQYAISHHISKETLPFRNESTYDVLKWIANINHNLELPLSNKATFVFSDIVNMNPSVNFEEAIEDICELYEKIPSDLKIPVNEIRIALHILQNNNFVSFGNEHFRPLHGIAMGPTHACDLTDIWIGKIAKTFNEIINVKHVGFKIYREDGSDILSEENDLNDYSQKLQSLHPNIDWEIDAKNSCAYLDMELFIENGKIESKIFDIFIKNLEDYLGYEKNENDFIESVEDLDINYRDKFNKVSKMAIEYNISRK